MVKIAGKDDKRQVTAVFASSMSGEFLSPQLFIREKLHVASHIMIF